MLETGVKITLRRECLTLPTKLCCCSLAASLVECVAEIYLLLALVCRLMSWGSRPNVMTGQLLLLAVFHDESPRLILKEQGSLNNRHVRSANRVLRRLDMTVVPFRLADEALRSGRFPHSGSSVQRCISLCPLAELA